MDQRNEYLKQAADRIEAEAQRTNLRADRAQLLNIAQECRDLATHLAERQELQERRPQLVKGRASSL